MKKMHKVIARANEDAEKPPIEEKPKSSISEGGNDSETKGKRRPKTAGGSKNSSGQKSLQTTSAPIVTQLPSIEEEHL